MDNKEFLISLGFEECEPRPSNYFVLNLPARKVSLLLSVHLEMWMEHGGSAFEEPQSVGIGKFSQPDVKVLIETLMKAQD